MENVIKGKDEGKKRYKGNGDALPDIPNWPNWINQVGLRTVEAWMAEERVEAHQKKETLPPEQYREFCKKKIKAYKDLHARERRDLEDGKKKMDASNALLFKWFFEKKIEFYEKERGRDRSSTPQYELVKKKAIELNVTEYSSQAVKNILWDDEVQKFRKHGMSEPTVRTHLRRYLKKRKS